MTIVGRWYGIGRPGRAVASAVVFAALVGVAGAAWAQEAAGTSGDAPPAPVIEAIIDQATGETLWSAEPSASGDTAEPLAGTTDAAGTADAGPTLKPGQRILLRGKNFGPGPITAAVPGIAPPAGGEPLPGEPPTVAASPAEADGLELSKVLFGRVRALERNLSSYRARIDLGTIAASLLRRVQGDVLDYFVEEHEATPDTWAGDLYGWSDTEIDLTVPIAAFEGPIKVVRIPTNGNFVQDIRTGEPLRYRDPNTARVITEDKDEAFTEGWRIARTRGQPVLTSAAVPVAIARGGGERMRYAAPAAAGTRIDDEHRARQALLDPGPLAKTTPTGRSAQDQFDYGERIYWAWDWNLALPHFILGVDWDGIFGFNFDQEDPYLDFVRDLRHKKSEIERPAIEAEGYEFPILDADGEVVEMRRHKAIIDRQSGTGLRPFPSFGAVPILPEAGADRLVAPAVVYEDQDFRNPAPYPIPMAIDLPFSTPLLEGVTRPTGWAGYVYAEAANPIPGAPDTAEWIGFACASCHIERVTFEYTPEGDTITKLFNGVPNPDWKATFLTASGRTHGLALDEELPPAFIRNDQPAGTRARVEDDFQVRLFGLWAALGLPGGERRLEERKIAASAEPVDKTLMIYNLPPGNTESTFFNEANQAGDYANDYFFSPQAIPIITNHTPVRRALSHSELLDGFEGAYLHGEEPEGARGPMSSRSNQALTLYASTLHQEDELLRRIGVYRWLEHKGLLDLLAADGEEAVGEGTFVSFAYPVEEITSPPTFPPKAGPASGLGAIRDHAIDPDGADAARAEAFAQRFPALAEGIIRGAEEFRQACARCHTPGHAGLWTNEDMHPISAAGGAEPVGHYFTPPVWQRRTQAIRTAILQNLFWVQQRGLLSDGHVRGDARDNMDGLAMLVDPARCAAPVGDDGSVDLDAASDLYKRLYTIRDGADHSFRIPGEGMPFEEMTRFGPERGVITQIAAADPERTVTDREDAFVARHAYFTKGDDGYYYWDYQKMRENYGILEFGLDPEDPDQAARIGGLPAAPHPWCLEAGAGQERVDDLVLFLLTL